MKNKQTGSYQGDSRLFSLPTYFSIIGYMLIALLIRAFALSPLLTLLVTPVGWSIKWLSILCPVLIITLILPLRFSFARAMLVAAQGGSFSTLRSLRLSQYQKKLSMSLRHALRILLWGLPLLLVLGWLYYTIVIMDAFTALHMFTSIGENAAFVLSTVVNFFTGIFGSVAVDLEGGIIEGLYVFAGIVVLTLLIFIWGIWRCSIYRYLWAAGILRIGRLKVKYRNILHGYRWKQLTSGIYNLILWLPTLFFLFLLTLSVQSKIINLVTLLFETKTFQPITFSQGEAVLCGIGLLCHIFILPLRRSETSKLIKTFLDRETSSV